MSYTAEIISVGTELLLGNVANTDARDISQILSELGINVYFHTVVGDNPERLISAVNIAKKRADIIITTGGLGPTCDDLTKQTLASCFGRELVFDEAEAEEIRSYFSKHLHSTQITENVFQQALLPKDCTVFRNMCGTAPGCAFCENGVHVLMLPGPPRECLSMFKNCAVPYLKALSDSEIRSHNIHIFGMGESAVEDKLRPMMLAMENPTLAPYAKDGEVMLRLTAKAKTAEEAEELMAPALSKVRDILGPFIYGIDTGTLEGTVVGLLTKGKKKLSVAESCTGGLLAKRLTDISGVSAVFSGGVITYSSRSKTELLGVDPSLIGEKGAVCAPVAIQMAKGVREKLCTDLGIGITGIAGPLSDESGAEVGLVYVAMACSKGIYCRTLHLGTDRTRIRTTAANHALDMLRRHLTDLPIETDAVAKQ